MNYSISCGSDQALIIDKLKSAGVDVIQSSSGLICKSTLSLQELEAAISTESCKIEQLTDLSSESPDIQKFLGED